MFTRFKAACLSDTADFIFSYKYVRGIYSPTQQTGFLWRTFDSGMLVCQDKFIVSLQVSLSLRECNPRWAMVIVALLDAMRHKLKVDIHHPCD